MGTSSQRHLLAAQGKGISAKRAVKCAIGGVPYEGAPLAGGPIKECGAVFSQHAANAAAMLGSSEHVGRRAGGGLPAVHLGSLSSSSSMCAGADNELLGRLAELVVVDAQGAVQPLEHVDFGDSELFFSGMQSHGLNVFNGKHLRVVRLLEGLLLELKGLHCRPLTRTPNRGGADHIALLHSVSKLYQHSSLPRKSVDKHSLTITGLQGIIGTRWVCRCGVHGRNPQRQGRARDECGAYQRVVHHLCGLDASGTLSRSVDAASSQAAALGFALGTHLYF